MKYKVVGPRILLKVKKLKETFSEGGRIVRPDEDKTQQDTLMQTKAIVEQIGSGVTDTYAGMEDLKVGDTVHFQRYGAFVLGSDKEDEYAHWVLNGKDVLCIEKQ